MSKVKSPSRPLYVQSPAAQALLRAGVRQQDVAEALGVARVTVSNMLNGRNRARPELFVALRALGGRALADEVARLIPQQEVAS